MAAENLIDNVASMIVFARVVEEGSFTAAAKRLGASKSHVSKQIAALERRLGAQLLRRTTRQMNLTEVGQLFYDRCARVAEEAEEAERSVHQMHASPRGEIRITAPMSFGLLHMARRMSAFLDQYPECRVDLRVTDAYADLIEERFDLAVRIGALPDSSFVARKLAPMRLAVAASPDYLARRGTPTEPEALRGHECLNYLDKTDLWSFTRSRRLEVEARLNINNGDALRAAALEGAGIVYLPTFLIGGDIAAGRLVPLLEEHVPQLHAIYAVYPASRHLSPKVRAMIDFLVDSFGNRPTWDAYLEGRESA